MEDLVGAGEIADRLGIAYRETIHSWRRRYDDFPEPMVLVGGVLIWDWSEVADWARVTGRL